MRQQAKWVAFSWGEFTGIAWGASSNYAIYPITGDSVSKCHPSPILEQGEDSCQGLLYKDLTGWTFGIKAYICWPSYNYVHLFIF